MFKEFGKLGIDYSLIKYTITEPITINSILSVAKPNKSPSKAPILLKIFWFEKITDLFFITNTVINIKKHSSIITLIDFDTILCDDNKMDGFIIVKCNNLNVNTCR